MPRRVNVSRCDSRRLLKRSPNFRRDHTACWQIVQAAGKEIRVAAQIQGDSGDACAATDVGNRTRRPNDSPGGHCAGDRFGILEQHVVAAAYHLHWWAAEVGRSCVVDVGFPETAPISRKYCP